MTSVNVVVKDWCDFDIGDIRLIKGQDISNNTECVKQWKKRASDKFWRVQITEVYVCLSRDAI